jgi:Predicted membrane protein (DUF2154).
MIIGVTILLLGVLFLVETLIPNFSVNIIHLWPVLLIAVATNDMLNKKRLDIFMSLLLFTGIWCFFYNTGVISISLFEIFLPVLLILVGGTIMISAIKLRRVTKKLKSSKRNSIINLYGVLSDVNEKVETDNFKGASIYSLLGRVNVDLTAVNIKEKAVSIYVYSIFGNAKFIMPKDHNVVMNSSSIFSQNENKNTNKYDKNNKNIYVHCISLFGGCEIR